MSDSRIPKVTPASKRVLVQPKSYSAFTSTTSNSNTKNAVPTLTRQATNLTSTSARRILPNRNLMRRSKSFSSLKSASKENVPFKKPTPVVKPSLPSKRAASSELAPNPSSSAPKQAKVKIPPYDFKARYNDLLGKHNALKEKHSVNENKIITLEKENLTIKHDIVNLKSQLEGITSAHDKLIQEHKQLQTTSSEVTSKYNNLEIQISILSQKYSDTCQLLKETESKNLEYLDNVKHLTNENKDLEIKVGTLNAKVISLETSVKEYEILLQLAHVQRKNLNNQILDLKGNIRVFCRIRPPLPVERDEELCDWSFSDDCSLNVAKSCEHTSSFNGAATPTKHNFAFDKVFAPCASQENVFEEVEGLVQSVLDGYNVCIFAYGQTGSGKTYTMEGSEHNMGLIPRCIEFIFKKVSDLKCVGWSFQISSSFLEIYNEQIHDLLDLSNRDLDIRLASSLEKNIVYVTNLTEIIVESQNELKDLLRRAQQNRATAQTESNERSSRSHSVSKIIISSSDPATGESFTGVLNLVDLAGSESPKTSVRMDETKNINKSLAQLGKVILSLQQKQSHIPYRSSKLTYLLMPSLGGNSKTLMFVNVNPLSANYSESINSLRFASQVNQVKTLKANRNKSKLPK
ncbi:protein claret segregational-like [Ctenocephalides felis]|uniref:protein claret segregational-like n=1 Tax=Ctenocephalides felis TaxID=7515 RepID=UPI000E6E3FD7|nr:protein claret segregational-like [Ctenocephalides felis]